MNRKTNNIKTRFWPYVYTWNGTREVQVDQKHSFPWPFGKILWNGESPTWVLKDYLELNAPLLVMSHLSSSETYDVGQRYY